MRIMPVFFLAVLAASPTLAAGTDPVVIYPYASNENYCPAGLQPVTVDGTVSCGTPTTDVTYQQAKTGTDGRSGRGSGSAYCPIATKGC